MERQTIRRISIVLTAALLIFTAVLAQWAYQRESKRKAELRQMAAQASEYQQQIEQIRREIEARRNKLHITLEKGMVAVSYLVETESEYEMIARQAEELGFVPSVMVNGDEPKSETFFSWMQQTGFETLISASDVSQSSRQAVQSFRQTLAQQGIRDPSAFLIRGAEYTREKINALAEDGFDCFIHFYRSTFDPVVRDKIASLPYTTVASDATDLTEVLDGLLRTKGNLLVVFQLHHLQTGALTEQGIEKQLKKLSAMEEAGTLQLGTLADAVARQKEVNQLRTQAKADFDAYEKEQQAVIAQLQSQIDEIYDAWRWN